MQGKADGWVRNGGGGKESPKAGPGGADKAPPSSNGSRMPEVGQRKGETSRLSSGLILLLSPMLSTAVAVIDHRAPTDLYSA